MEKAKKYQEMLKLLKKATQKKEKDKDMKKMNKGGMNDKNKKVVPLMPTGVIYKGKAKDYPGIKKIIKDKYKKSKGGSMESEGPLRQRATYGQRSKQKVFERKQKIMKRAKGGSTEFGMLSVKAGIDKNPNPTAADRIAGAKMKQKPKKANLGMLMMKKAKDKGAKGPELLSPLAMVMRIAKKDGGEVKKGYGAARQKGEGLQDENLTPGKTMDYYKDLI